MKKHKHLDFELNLIPFIDLLSTCICFLLLTAVWVQVGSMNVKQAVGGQPAAETEKKPTLWVAMSAGNEITLDARDGHVPPAMAKIKVPAKDGKIDFDTLSNVVQHMKEKEPALTTALIQPQAASVYEDIIELMDRFKKSGLIDLGVAPL